MPHRGIMDKLNALHQHITSMTLSGGITFFAWLESLTVIQIIGIIVLLIQLYFGYRKHRREEYKYSKVLKQEKEGRANEREDTLS